MFRRGLSWLSSSSLRSSQAQWVTSSCNPMRGRSHRDRPPRGLRSRMIRTQSVTQSRESSRTLNMVAALHVPTRTVLLAVPEPAQPGPGDCRLRRSSLVWLGVLALGAVPSVSAAIIRGKTRHRSRDVGCKRLSREVQRRPTHSTSSPCVTRNRARLFISSATRFPRRRWSTGTSTSS